VIIVSDAVVLSPGLQAQGIDGRNPRIGWHNLATQSNVFADQEDDDHPVKNIGNQATFLYWKGTSSAAQTVGVGLAGAETVNYLALARHNFGTIAADYTIESSTNGTDWTALTDSRILPNDNSLIHEFEDEFASSFRLNIASASGIPEIGVLYLGRILKLSRTIYVGHTPITYGRRSDVTNNFSEDGQFLGRVVRNRMYESSVSMQNIAPDFYRDEIDPFFHESVEMPFFIAWRPSSYPTETGYVWMKGDPSMANQRPNSMVEIDFQFQGIR
jgi:hypothetical protein